MHFARLPRRGGAWALPLAGMLAAAWGSPASASGLTGKDAWSAHFDLRLVAADGARSWTDGGFGKTRFDGESDGGLAVRPVAAEGALVWEPDFGWDLSGSAAIVAQHAQDHPVDLSEAYLSWKPVPKSATRWRARAGLYWPAVSLEHEGGAWAVADMITPSAINSWIGEEVKVVGAEATASRQSEAGRVSATLGLFGFNDTSGTLLAFRGWALHDLKATAFGKQKLPPLNPFMLFAQAPETKPLIELDGRPGFYGKIGWQPPAPVSAELFYYDNRGDPEAVNDGLQWGWRTRFLSLGARIDLDERTKILAQVLTGGTEMGFPDGSGRLWVETRYRAGYARVTHQRGRLALSGRIDLFGTRERGSQMEAAESEDGWAASAAARWRISKNFDLIGELLRVDSERAVRVRDGLAPAQSETLVQTSVRITL